MRISISLFASSLFLYSLALAPNVSGTPSDFSFSDEVLMTFDETYVVEWGGKAHLSGKTDVPGLGVEYDVTLDGSSDPEIGIGTQCWWDFSSYSGYFLRFTNTSPDDWFGVNVYLKTGPEETYSGTVWLTLGPGMASTVTLDLSSVANINNVREIGFGLSALIGTQLGQADAIRVMVQGQEDMPMPPPSPVPEAGTLTMFGSGLLGLLAAARRKLGFLTQ